MNTLLFLQHHLLQKQRVQEHLLWKKGYKPSGARQSYGRCKLFSWTWRRAEILEGHWLPHTSVSSLLTRQIAPSHLLWSDYWHLWTLLWFAPATGHYANRWDWAYYVKQAFYSSYFSKVNFVYWTFILKLRVAVKILICPKVNMSDDVMPDSIKEQPAFSDTILLHFV